MNNSTNFLSNTTSQNIDTKFFGYLTIPLIFLGTIGSLLSFVLIRINFISLQPSMITLLQSLSLATLFFSGFSFPVNAFTMITGSPNFLSSRSGTWLCQATAFIYYYAETACVYSHTSIAINRLLVVVMANKSYCGPKVMTIMLVAFAWLSPLLIFGYPLGTLFAEYGYAKSSNRCAIKTAKPGYVMYYKLGYSIVPFTIICFCYTVVVIFVKSTSWKMRARTLAENTNETSSVRKMKDRGRQLMMEKRERRLTNIAFITCFVFMVGYLPNALLGLMGNLAGVHSSAGTIVMLWMQLGCATSPIVYILLSARQTQIRDLTESMAHSIRFTKHRSPGSGGKVAGDTISTSASRN